MLRHGGAADRVEWWSPTQVGAPPRLEAADGEDRGRRTAFSVGLAGTLVVVGDRWGTPLRSAVNRLAPVLRRRWTDEQLAGKAVQLARQNQALEDFATLVAHELKGPLHAALLQDDPSAGVQRALDLIDSLLEVARAESVTPSSSPVGECLDEALRDLEPLRADVVANLPREFPLPPAVLRLVLRNLLANAAAAGAASIHIGAAASARFPTLVVHDDGVGLAELRRYAVGSRLGLGLCRRLVSRFGGTLEVTTRTAGGTRATLVVRGLGQ